MGWYRIGIKVPPIAPVNPDVGTVLRDLLQRGLVRSDTGADGREVFYGDGCWRRNPTGCGKAGRAG